MVLYIDYRAQIFNVLKTNKYQTMPFNKQVKIVKICKKLFFLQN